MTLRLSRTMPGFEGVPAGGSAGKATLRLPIGLTYHQLEVDYSGVTLAQMTGIRLYANAELIHDYDTGTRLDLQNQFDGRAAAAGLLILDFDRFNLRTRDGEELTSIGTGVKDDPTPITTLTLEIDISAAAAGAVLSALAIQSTPRAAGVIKKVRRFTFVAAGAGDLEISTQLPKGDLINRVFFHESANDIDRLQVIKDLFTVFDRTKERNARFQEDGVRTPQTNLYAYDPTESGNGAEGLVTADTQDLRFILTVDGAMTVTTLVEYIGGIKQV